MAAIPVDAPRAADPGLAGPVPARTAGPAADRSLGARPARSWPLLVLAVPAAAEVFSGWAGIAQKTGFGSVCPLPGIWPCLHLDTAITLPAGVEAHAAYALRAWLARGEMISVRTRRFARWPAIFSFALEMAGQVACHLMAQAGMARAPWAVTTIVSCLPVLVLATGTALVHMLRADAGAARAAGTPDSRAGRAASRRPLAWSWQDQAVSGRRLTGTGPGSRTRTVPGQDHNTAAGLRDVARGPPGRRPIRPV